MYLDCFKTYGINYDFVVVDFCTVMDRDCHCGYSRIFYRTIEVTKNPSTWTGFYLLFNTTHRIPAFATSNTSLNID